MTTDPRAALERLVVALEAHLSAVAGRRGDDDPAVGRAYETLADAFELYDESLFDSYGETTPFELYDEDDDDDLDDDDDDDGDEGDEDDDDEDDLDEDDLTPDDDLDDLDDDDLNEQS